MTNDDLMTPVSAAMVASNLWGPVGVAHCESLLDAYRERLADGPLTDDDLFELADNAVPVYYSEQRVLVAELNLWDRVDDALREYAPVSLNDAIAWAIRELNLKALIAISSQDSA